MGNFIYLRKEKNRYMIAYQWRCTFEEKKALLHRAADEGRTANKVLSDALKLYLKNK